MIAFGDSLPDADGAMIKLTRKCRRKSLFSLQDTIALSPREELPTGVAQPSMSSYRHTETTFFSLLAVEEMLIIQVTVQLTSVEACTSSKTLFRGTNNNNIPSVIPQVGSEFQGKVGMKFSTVLENEELCISALLESSGFSFSLTWIKNASE
ncbi:hypothetical protein K7X08_019664 [Anisodus acutangulus]|uniref:DUF7806 domain-containing protein n=1 Tax=Anisodus acutangulus TaxID=402998 RepID=A0A9Q1MVC9_9SOLA|nr:hypothetical protein K7X08_019664 [Anisodus acutangulus]